MGVPTQPVPKGLDAVDVTFARPDLTAFCRLDELGLVVVGLRVDTDHAVLA